MSGSAYRVPNLLEAMKDIREGPCVISSDVDCTMAARVLTLGSTRGG